MNLSEYIATTAPEKAQIAQERGWRLHRGPANPAAELETVMKRAKASYAARIHKLPAPTWGRRNAGRSS